MVVYHFADIPAPVRVRAKTTADNTNIRVLWEWPRQGLLKLHVLPVLSFTIDLRDTPWLCTQWTVQQQPVPPCPTSSATHSTSLVCVLGVV